MQERGELFSHKLKEGREKLPKIVLPFISDGSSNVQFTVYVTMGAPTDKG
ncbi:hypothetical protein B566_EDAN014000 [Ephemera danica]|nr:hypothetical protein B566_EDAN014000 [Ephemera danica]